MMVVVKKTNMHNCENQANFRIKLNFKLNFSADLDWL